MLTNSVIRDYFKCEYKAYAKQQEQVGTILEFETLENKISEDIKERYYSQLLSDKKQVLNDFDLKKIIWPFIEMYVVNPSLKTKDLDISFDAIRIINKSHKNEPSYDFRYCPIEIIPREKITANDKLVLAIKCLVFSQNLNLCIETGQIIHGYSMSRVNIKLISYLKNAQKHLKKILSLTNKKVPPDIYWIEHCKVCEFQKFCKDKLIERDDISLLSGINKKDAIKWKNKGIFTILQLSYTFKPKKREKLDSACTKTDASLKALALRDQKVYVKELPNIKTYETEVYLDFEGIPDENFIYLIGALIITNNQESHLYSWIDSKDKQEDLFRWLFEILKRYQDIHIFHYGNYEIKALEKFNKCADNFYCKEIDFIKNNSINILPFLTSRIYLPTYTNGLKEIASFLDFSWTKKDASGIASIVWRKKWELFNDEDAKNDLILYNKEDCLALKLVKQWLNTINSKLNAIDDNIFCRTKEVEVANKPKWGDTNYKISDFEDVNRLAYFDYQRNRIFIRTNKKIRKVINRSRRINKSKSIEVDKNIKVYPETCPDCGGKELLIKDKKVKVLIDLKFIKGGIKRWVQKIESGIFECQHCQKRFTHDEYDQLIRYRSNFKYGHNLISWCIYEYVVHQNSYAKISNMLSDYYGLEISLWAIPNFRKKFAHNYMTTYEELKQCLIKGELICADETKIDLLDSQSSAYVWVFTSMTSIVYLPRLTREGDFLQEFLGDFNGVLISDFYSAYNSLNCLQQKCLVHLIRDLNNDFVKNQFDNEFKVFVIEFGKLLRKIIVETIDRYGLKKRYLGKHKRDVDNFFTDFVDKESDSEILEKYQKRFKKYREKLFLFLNHDGVPWNNNNAEHAIKPFTKYRRDNNGKVTEKTLSEYLVLLSIQQTCEYRGLNFLEFLKSGEKSIENFSAKCLKW